MLFSKYFLKSQSHEKCKILCRWHIRISEHKKNSRHEYSNRPIGFTVYGICKSVVKESDYPTKGNNFCIEWIGLYWKQKRCIYSWLCVQNETFCVLKKKKDRMSGRAISNDRRSNRVNPPLQSSFKKKSRKVFLNIGAIWNKSINSDNNTCLSEHYDWCWINKPCCGDHHFPAIV